MTGPVHEDGQGPGIWVRLFRVENILGRKQSFGNIVTLSSYVCVANGESRKQV